MSIHRYMPNADRALNKHKIVKWREEYFKPIMFDYASDLVEKFRQDMVKMGYADNDLLNEFDMDKWLAKNI